MGPRSFERGNKKLFGQYQLAVALQWGRARSSAETKKSYLLRYPVPTHFNGAALVRARKRNLLHLVLSGPYQLQWGRARSSAETSP